MTSAAARTLDTYFNAIYATTLGVLEVGIPGAAGFSIRFTSAGAVREYPACGPFAALTHDLFDPGPVCVNGFAGEVTALALNVDFADAGAILASSGVRFGDLTICGLAGQPLLNGHSVRELRAIAETALGGGAQLYPIADLSVLLELVNRAFDGGVVAPFASDHLFSSACP